MVRNHVMTARIAMEYTIGTTLYTNTPLLGGEVNSSHDLRTSGSDSENVLSTKLTFEFNIGVRPS